MKLVEEDHDRKHMFLQPKVLGFGRIEVLGFRLWALGLDRVN